MMGLCLIGNAIIERFWTNSMIPIDIEAKNVFNPSLLVHLFQPFFLSWFSGLVRFVVVAITYKDFFYIF